MGTVFQELLLSCRVVLLSRAGYANRRKWPGPQRAADFLTVFELCSASLQVGAQLRPFRGAYTRIAREV